MSPTHKRRQNAQRSGANDKRQIDIPSTNSHRSLRRYSSYAILLTALLLTVFSGLLHGKLTNQWGLPSQAIAAAKDLEEFPEQFGTWKMVDEHEPSKTVVEMLECVGYVHRTYVNQETGQVVNYAIILGPTGPTSVHTPEICYSSRSYSIHDEREVVRIRGGSSELWALTFQSKDIDQSLLRVYYGWTYDGKWGAPKRPRLAHVGLPFLYKIQLASRLPSGADLEHDDSCRDFLEEFLPTFEGRQFNRLEQ